MACEAKGADFSAPFVVQSGCEMEIDRIACVLHDGILHRVERPTSGTKRVSTAIAERLPPDHLAWLKEFSVVMHRRYAYPSGHPSRVAAERVAFAALDHALERYPEIAIGVSRNQLAIGGGFSDPKNPAICELAERFHRQGIGAITVRTGMSPEEFDALLSRIVEAKSTDGGESGDADRTLGPHVAVEMLRYEGLALSDEADDEDGSASDVTSDRLWRELAQVALTGWDGEDGRGSGGGGTAAVAGESNPGASDAGAPAPADGAPDTAPPESRRRGSAAMLPGVEQEGIETVGRLARVINARSGDKQFAAKVLKSIIRVGRHSRRRGRAGSGAVAARLRDVMKKLEPGTLRSLLDSEPNPERKRLLFLQGVDALPVSVVLDWIEAAAANSGRSISPYLLRLMKKLSGQARRRRDGGPDEGGESLRQAARQLIEGWTLETRETEAHSGLLEQISNYEKAEQALDVEASAGADRIVQMALETDAFGPDVTAAVDHLIDHRHLTTVFGFLDELPDSTTAAPSILDYLEAPETLRRVLLAEPLDADAARKLMARCGPASLDPLLDVLVLSESQATRQMILDRLREFDEAAREPIMARLEGSPWYVLRNLLALLVAMPATPPDLQVDAYAHHEEPTVRVEALKLLARIPSRREDAIHDALADPDMRVLRAAIDAAHAGLPRRSALRVLQIVQKAEAGSELRLRGIALLDNVPLAAARDWLLPIVSRMRGMFFWRRRVLQPRSPEMLAALRVLASEWRKDPKAFTTFRLAAQSGDEQVREAAGMAAKS
jgi:hypothetical protein